MDIKEIILDRLNSKGRVTAADIIADTGFTRAYINRYFRELREDGVISLIGKANKAHYVKAGNTSKALAEIREVRLRVRLKGLNEHDVFDKIKRETGIFLNMRDNVSSDVQYAFSEMLNNAIDHSRSIFADVSMRRTDTGISFVVKDKGIGIFNNIKQNKKLASEDEAIQDLLKGKQTTAPDAHSGEGIFFTSKIADRMTISSFGKSLVFFTAQNDTYIVNSKIKRGTTVSFRMALDTKKNLTEIFHEYTSDFVFDKTTIDVKLFEQGVEYVSRSQARRLLVGLEKFKRIILDFKNVATIGQSFADEVFRVWQKDHPSVEISAINTGANVDFMVKRALSMD